MGIHRDNKGRWVVQVRATFGQTKWRECKRFPPDQEKAAKEYLDDVTAEVRHLKRQERLGEDVEAALARAVASPSFAELAESWIRSADLRDGTRRLYQGYLDRHLVPALGGMVVRDIRPQHVLGVQEQLNDGSRRANGVNGILRALSSCLGYAVRRELIASNPCSPVKPLRGRRLGTTGHPLTPQQEAELLLAAPPRWRRLSAFMLASGARIGEARGVRWQDVDADGVTFSEQITGDGARARRGPLKDDEVGGCRRVPWRQLRLRDVALSGGPGVGGDLVFATADGSPLGEANARRAFQRLAEGRLGWRLDPLPDGTVEHYSPHDARHTWATRLADAGVALEKIRQWGGWSSLRLVQRYARATDEAALALLRTAEAGSDRDAQATREDREEGRTGDAQATRGVQDEGWC